MEIEKLKEISRPLCEDFLKFKTSDDMFCFLRDLLTQWEIIEFSQRLSIAKKLSSWISYKNIEKETWASSTTIARVAKFLNGKFGGYQKIVK